VRAEGRRGRTPPRRLGGTVLEEVRATVVPIVDATRPWAGGTARSVDLTVPLPDGRLLTGTLTGLHGDTLVRAVYSRLAAKHRLRAWVQLLALAASDAGSPERPYRAVTIGRAGQRAAAGVSVLTCPSPHHATRWLAQLVALRDAALREPLPLPVATTCAYARSRHARNDVPEALADAAREWAAGTYQFGEQGDDHHVLVWGEDAALRDVAGTPDAEEATWWPQEGTRLGVLARRVWEPLLEHERTETA
jgi:exodeoxyribonuclease V gamma subunit